MLASNLLSSAVAEADLPPKYFANFGDSVEGHIVGRSRKAVSFIGEDIILDGLVVLAHSRHDLITLRFVYAWIVGALPNQQGNLYLVRLKQWRFLLEHLTGRRCWPLSTSAWAIRKPCLTQPAEFNHLLPIVGSGSWFARTDRTCNRRAHRFGCQKHPIFGSRWTAAISGWAAGGYGRRDESSSCCSCLQQSSKRNSLPQATLVRIFTYIPKPTHLSSAFCQTCFCRSWCSGLCYTVPLILSKRTRQHHADCRSRLRNRTLNPIPEGRVRAHYHAVRLARGENLLSDSRALAVWFLHQEVGLPYEEANQYVLDQTNDCGVDFIWEDKEGKQVLIGQIEYDSKGWSKEPASEKKATESFDEFCELSQEGFTARSPLRTSEGCMASSKATDVDGRPLSPLLLRYP